MQGFCGGAIDAIANAAISVVHGAGVAPWMQVSRHPKHRVGPGAPARVCRAMYVAVKSCSIVLIVTSTQQALKMATRLTGMHARKRIWPSSSEICRWVEIARGLDYGRMEQGPLDVDLASPATDTEAGGVVTVARKTVVGPSGGRCHPHALTTTTPSLVLRPPIPPFFRTSRAPRSIRTSRSGRDGERGKGGDPKPNPNSAPPPPHTHLGLLTQPLLLTP